MARNPDDPDLEGFAKRLALLPSGTFAGVAAGRRYIVTKTIFNAGRSIKLVAEELGGRDYVSLNFYDLHNGGKLAPCEMPATKVIGFVLRFRPDKARKW
ncbi:MAG: hypothetical protein AAF665_08145 [Pseudomonadota bacterium]